MKNIILYVLVSIIFVFMLFFANMAHKESKNYESITSSLVEHGSPENLAESKLKDLAESFSFGMYKNDKKDELVKLKEKARVHKELSQQNTLYFMYLLLGVLLSFFLLPIRAFTFLGALSAIITLVYGLITPILMVTIHKDVKYLGDVILSFESKSVLGSIEKLFQNGDFIVASTILLFSILIPVVKTSSLAFVSLFMKSKFAHSIVKFFKVIGKWSMVDVFVVASFLVYLTMNKGNVSRAEVEVGLYFFLAYVIVSMFVSLSADKMLHKE